MKKNNVSLMVIAAVAAITSAFATKSECLQCEGMQQYYKDVNTYIPLGQYGVDYDCDYDITKTCTWYKPNPGGQPNLYSPCRLGIWIDLGGRASN